MFLTVGESDRHAMLAAKKQGLLSYCQLQLLLYMCVTLYSTIKRHIAPGQNSFYFFAVRYGLKLQY